MKVITHIIITLLLISFSSKAWCSETQNHEYKFGVFPYLSSDMMHDIYFPVSRKLSDELEQDVKFLTEASHKKFIQRLNNEYYDFVLIPPFWFPVAVDHKQYLPALKMAEPFVSLILTLDNSTINAVNDLKGKTVSTPPGFSPVVSLITRELVDQGLVPGRDVIFKSNETVDECLQQLIDNNSSACISPPYAPAHFERKTGVKLRKILTSASIPSVALLIHSRVDKESHQKIYNSFLSLDKTPQGRALLQGMQTKRFIPVVKNEYDVVKDIMKKSKFIH